MISFLQSNFRLASSFLPSPRTAGRFLSVCLFVSFVSLSLTGQEIGLISSHWNPGWSPRPALAHGLLAKASGKQNFSFLAAKTPPPWFYRNKTQGGPLAFLNRPSEDEHLRTAMEANPSKPTRTLDTRRQPTELALSAEGIVFTAELTDTRSPFSLV